MDEEIKKPSPAENQEEAPRESPEEEAGIPEKGSDGQDNDDTGEETDRDAGDGPGTDGEDAVEQTEEAGEEGNPYEDKWTGKHDMGEHPPHMSAA